MNHLPLPYLSTGLAALFAASWLVTRSRNPRKTAVLAALLAFTCMLLAAIEVLSTHDARLFDPFIPWLEADTMDIAPLVMFSMLTLGVLILMPRHDAGGNTLSGMLMMAGATLMAYAAANLLMLATGWWLTSLPFVLNCFPQDRARHVTRGFLITSSIALTTAIAALHHVEISDLSHVGTTAFVCLILAVVLRKGVFPFHGWMIQAFEHGPLLPLALLFNGHLGALLVVRSETAALPVPARHALEILGIAALATALITSIRAFAEKKPRRMLGLLCVSQASFILAGIATADPEGITGALVLWMVVAGASTGLIAVVRALEVRVLGSADPSGHLGLAVKAPRLATFFLICGLALVGLPGTLGYCAEDLLFHGALKSNSWLGLALPIATAFNAINLIRLFNILFLGVLPKHVIDIPDALPRERIPLAFCVTALIAGGIFPAQIVKWGAAEAHHIQSVLQKEHTQNNEPLHQSGLVKARSGGKTVSLN